MQRYDYLARDAELFSPKDGREFCVLECLLKEVVKNKYKDCSSWCSIGYAVVWDKDHCSNTVHNCITQSEDFSAHSLLVHIQCELVWKSRGEIEDMGFSFRTDEQNPWSYIEVTLVVWLILQFSLAALVILLGHRMSRISKSLYNARIRNSLLRVNSEKQNSTKHRMLMCLERSIKGITALLNFRVLVNIIQICLSILVCLLSTITISIQEVHWIWAAFRTFFLLFFVFDFVARARLHSGPIYRFLFEGFTIADLLSIVSMIVSLSSWPSLAFLRAFVAVSAFRELRPILKTKFRISSVSSELLILIIEATALLYAFATLIFLLEKLGDPTWLSFSRDSVSFFNALYFVFITATTVGYGDSLITTFLAQLFVILFVILGIMIFADRISKIVQYMNASRDGLGNFSNPYQDPFVILAGDLTFNMVQDFLEEFYHPNSIVDALDMRRRVVILSKSINAAGSVFITEYERFLENNPALIGRLQILVGSPMNASDLIHRARAREADCMFIISNSLAEDSHLDDTANIFRAMAVQRMAPELRVFLSLQNSTAMNILPAARLSENRSICTGVSKMQIMAISSFVPGFSTFLHSLVKTYCSQHDHNQPSSTSWSGQNDFQRGLDREFYVVKSRHEDAGKKLGELALDLFLNHDIIVVGFAYFVSYANEGSRRSSRGIRQSIASEISEERPQRSIRCVFDPNAPIALSSLLLVIADDRIQASLAGMWHESNISKSKLDLSIVRKDSGISRWLKASKQMIFSDAPLKNSIFPADEFLDGGVITSKCFGNNSDIRSDGFIFHPPPSNLVDHIIVICSSLDSVPHFVEKHRVIEMGCSSKENSSLGNSPWTPIVIVLTSSQPESTNCFNFVPSKFLREVYLIRSTLQNALDFKQICAHKAKSIVIVDNEKVSSTNPNQREFELLDVRSVLTWTRIRQYLDGYYIFNEPEFDMEEKLAESDNSEITEPFVMIELKNESSLRYLTTWLSNPKGTETSEFEEDLLHNEIFSSGSAISERLPQLIISHSYINAGFLQFAKALISECGKTHIFEYAEAGSFTVFLEAFKFYLEKGKLALGIYRNPDHFSCDCWSSSSSSLPHMLSGPSGSTKLCPKDRILLLLPVPDPHKSP